MAEATRFTLLDRVFRITNPEDLGLQQDGYIAAALERAGITDPALEPLTGEALIREANLRLLETGRIGEFLAGYLVEDGKPWTLESAREHARAFNAVRRQEDRDGLLAMTGGLLVGFFDFARRSWPTGPSSSAAPEPGASSASAAASTTGTGSP